MKKSISHFGLIFFWIFGWFFTLLKVVIYLIGVSTVPEDAKALGIKVQSLVNFVSTIPQWVFYGFMFLFVAYLMSNVFSFKEIIRGRSNSKELKLRVLARNVNVIAENLRMYRRSPFVYEDELPRYMSQVHLMITDLHQNGFPILDQSKMPDDRDEILGLYIGYFSLAAEYLMVRKYDEAKEVLRAAFPTVN